MNWLVVIPSIRDVTPEYLEPLGDTDLAIIDDTNGSISKTNKPKSWRVIDYAGRKAILGANDDLVPRKNPSCKGVGLALAWKDGYDGVILLDDDCDLRITPTFLEEIPVGKTTQVVEFDGPGGWLNTMELLGEPALYARGYPYEYRGGTHTFGESRWTQSLFNAGLWSWCPDINGIDKLRELSVPDEDRQEVVKERFLTRGSVALKDEQKLPLSIMNVQLHRSLIPAFYQPPDWPVAGGQWNVRRHDDVFAAIVLKYIMDRLGDGQRMTAGRPLVRHAKVGDMAREVLSEHCTHLLQGHVDWAASIAAVPLEDGMSYAEAAEGVGERMASYHFAVPGRFGEIVKDYGERIAAWARIFKE